jgi:hypothetical protein
MVLAVAMALGKYPHEVAGEMSADQIIAFNLYLDILEEERAR